MHKLFDDMTPTEKLAHCERCIADGLQHLKAEHGPVFLADILDVWDYWTPYLLGRLGELEKVAEVANQARIAWNSWKPDPPLDAEDWHGIKGFAIQMVRLGSEIDAAEIEGDGE